MADPSDDAYDDEKPHCYLDINVGEEFIGRLTIELYYDVVPRTAENFKQLCTHQNGERFGYRGSKFHRIVKGFMCQGGEFSIYTGLGGKSIYGYRFDDENFLVKHDAPGILSMANSGRNKNACQFFICAEATEWLDNKHVAFGKVIKNFDVVLKILEYGQDSGRPTANVHIADCGIILSPAAQKAKDEADAKKAAEEEAARKEAEEAAKKEAEEAAKKEAEEAAKKEAEESSNDQASEPAADQSAAANQGEAPTADQATDSAGQAPSAADPPTADSASTLAADPGEGTSTESAKESSTE